MQPIAIDAQFECANAVDIERRGNRDFILATRPDCAVDNARYEMADYYVAFRLHNPNPEPVTVNITYRERAYPETGRTIGLRNLFPGRPPRVDEWFPLAVSRLSIDAASSSCSFQVTVAAGAGLDISSMYWMSASEVYDRLEQLRERCRVRSLGRTAQGRDIPLVALSAGNSARPLAVVAATPQCHELGTIATMSLLEAAVADDLSEVTGELDLVFLPLTNPDGNALGNCMTNALKQNVIFGFGLAGTGKAATECEAVWQYLEESRPAFFLEYHSYPHLNRPSFRSYDLDRSFFPDEESRARGERFFQAVAATSPNSPVAVTAGSPMSEQFAPSLISRLVRDLGIPATLYKLHNRESIDANTRQARHVLESVARAMSASR